MIRLAPLWVVPVVWMWACSQPTTPAALPVVSKPRVSSAEPLRVIPPAPSLEPKIVALGARLFNETGLSSSGKMSCATCHDLSAGGTDRRLHVLEDTTFDTPTVFNSGLNARLFWDGRARTLEEQIDGPLLSKDEMASDWPKVLTFLRASPDYVRQFDAAFADAPTIANVKLAIASFERTLLTRDSPFDRHLNGEPGSLSADQQRGYALFKEYGCASCHQGANVGGSMFERLGVMADYFQGRRGLERDRGRARVTAAGEDENVFRVPSLRLSARTAPYLHDGSIATLDETIELMGVYQLGIEIPPKDRQQIAAFLESLVGKYQGKAL